MSTIPARSNVDYGDLFALERRTLVALLRDLRNDDWTRPTSCPGWSLLDLTCHLVGDDLGLLARQRDGHPGMLPPDDVNGDRAFATWLDDVQDAWVSAARRLSPHLVVDLLSWTGPQVVEMLRLQDPAERAATVSWASSGLVPRWLDHARELSEQWIHRQQIEAALGRPTGLGDPTAAAVLDALRWAYPHRLSALSAHDGDTVDIAVAGQVERRWLLAYNDAAWSFVQEAGKRVIARAEMSSSDAWRLLTNNMPPSEQRRLRVEGDPTVVDVLLRTRAIIGIPK